MTEKALTVIEPKIVLETEKDFDPKEFFKDRTGLFVSSSFENRILPKADTLLPFKINLASFKLLERAADSQIEEELPKDHLFTETEVCAIIADLIEKQSKGEEGILLNDGSWNLFYTESCVVHVHWRRFHGAWHVGTWDRDGSQWGAGERVFSPATEN